jgi:hypothetical protein
MSTRKARNPVSSCQVAPCFLRNRSREHKRSQESGPVPGGSLRPLFLLSDPDPDIFHHRRLIDDFTVVVGDYLFDLIQLVPFDDELELHPMRKYSET